MATVIFYRESVKSACNIGKRCFCSLNDTDLTADVV
jgi:hypothetical protein